MCKADFDKVNGVYPTLDEVLDLPVIKNGLPRVRAGSGQLDAAVRWVHVSELSDVAGTLTGGELILSTGGPLTDPGHDVETYVASLQDAGAVGLMVELGRNLLTLPDSLVQVARRRAFPLVELRRSVRFVEITEVVHAQIINTQYEQLRFSERVREAFSGMGVDGATADDVVARIHDLTGYPAVLEDLGHHALVFAGEQSAASLLRDWSERSRQVPLAAQTVTGGPEGWAATPVGPMRQRWGRLVVPLRVNTDSAGVSLVLERAAEVLTISRLVGPATGDVTRLAQSKLVHDLMHRAGAPEGALRARASALGLRTDREFSTLFLIAAGHGGDADAEVVEASLAAADRAGAEAVAGAVAPGRIAVIMASRTKSDPGALPDRVAQSLPVGLVRAMSSSGSVATLRGLSIALSEAAEVADAVVGTSGLDSHLVYRGQDLGLRGVLWKLRDDPRLQTFCESTLSAVLALPERERVKTIVTLRAYLDAGGNVTEFARAIRTSRPAAYSRIAYLNRLLGVDLQRPEDRTSIHVAVLAHVGG